MSQVTCHTSHVTRHTSPITGGPRERGQVFNSIVWQKVKGDADDDDNAAGVRGGENGIDDDDDDDDDDDVDDDDDDVDDDADADNTHSDASSSEPHPSASAAANFIRAIFNRAPPPPSTLREAWYDKGTRHTSHVTHHTSHVTRCRTGFRAPSTGGGRCYA